MKPFRLAFVNRHFWPIAGLTELSVAELACAMRDLGWLPEIVTARWDKSWPSSFSYRGIPVARVTKPISGPWGSFRYLRRLSREMLSRSDLDAVMVSGLADEAVTLAHTLPPEVPLVIRVDHRSASPNLAAGQLSRRQLAALKKAAAVVTDCQAIGRDLIRYGANKSTVRVIKQGVAVDFEHRRTTAGQGASRMALADAHPILAVDPSQPLVCTGAAMDTDGGSLDLLAAWSIVLQSFPKAKLWLLGNGSHGKQIWDAVVARHLVYSVIMPGFFDDLGDVFNAADLYVHPSRRNGPCGCLLRAMASGLAVVSTKTHFTRSLIRKDLSGLLVPANNPMALAEAIMHALKHNELRCRTGAAAKRIVAERCPLAKEVQQYCQLFSPRVDEPCESVT